MKKKKLSQRKRRRILFAILMILLVGVVLTASTYAWFTANQTVKVEDIDVNVSTSQGLQISVDGSDWRALVTKEEIKGALATYSTSNNQIPNTMVPVSTIKDIDTDTGYMNMFVGNVTADGLGISKLSSAVSLEDGSTSAKVEAGDFVVFDLFFKLTTANTEGEKIYLTSNSAVTSTDGKGIENAARIAFLNEGNVDASSTITAIQALKGASSAILWEPNNNAHTQASINHASSVYHFDGLMDGANLAAGHHAVLTTGGTGAVVPSYYGLRKTFENAALDVTSDPESPSNDDLVRLVTPDLKTGTAGISTENYLEAFTLHDGITKMRIYMWIEGQDVDCQDAASGSDLVYSLQFSLLNGAAGA